MKRSKQMKCAGIPSAINRRLLGTVLTMRNPHWREIRIVTGYDNHDLPIVEYRQSALIRAK